MDYLTLIVPSGSQFYLNFLSKILCLCDVDVQEVCNAGIYHVYGYMMMRCTTEISPVGMSCSPDYYSSDDYDEEDEESGNEADFQAGSLVQ